MRPIDIRASQGDDREETWAGGDITAALDVLVRYRKTFVAVVGLIIASGLLYAFLASPVYRTDIMVQVEEPSGNTAASRLMAGISPMFDVKAAANADVELLHSRMVVRKAVENLPRYKRASPSILPGTRTANPNY